MAQLAMRRLFSMLYGIGLGFSGHFSDIVGGVIIAISPSLCSLFTDTRHPKLDDGRILLTECTGPHGSLWALNVHLPTSGGAHLGFESCTSEEISTLLWRRTGGSVVMVLGGVLGIRIDMTRSFGTFRVGLIFTSLAPPEDKF
eukprot:7815120-Pyramimonas_sp.AAC.1